MRARLPLRRKRNCTPPRSAVARRGSDVGLGAGHGARSGPRSCPGARGCIARSSPQAPTTAVVSAAPRTDLQWTQALDQAAFALAGATKVRPSSAADCFPGRSGHNRRCGLPFASARRATRGNCAELVDGAGGRSLSSDARRFDNPRQMMAFLGLVPSERSTGERVRRAGLTLAGNKRARRVLIEGAWSYRYPARVSQTLQARLEGLPKTVREIAWKAQIRLCARYRRLTAAGKKRPVVIAAIAREMAAFLWAIAQHVAPTA